MELLLNCDIRGPARISPGATTSAFCQVSSWILTSGDLSIKLWVGWTRKAEVRARQRRQQVEHDDICAEYSSQKHWRNIVRRQRRLSLLLTSAGGRKNMLFYLNLCFQWKPSAFSRRHKPTHKNYFSPNYHNLTRSRTCT